MQARSFYELDCYSLNKKARFFYPFQHRLEDLLGYFFPQLHKKNTPAKLDKRISEKLKRKLRSISLQIDWEQNIQDSSYIVFDTETTGLSPLKGDKIISMGAVLVEKGEIKEDRIFEQLVYPGRSIAPEISKLTGITDYLVASEPTIHQVLLDFIDYVGNKILVAHNAAFDLAFLNIALGQIGKIRIVNPVIDTHVLATSLLPNMTEYTLEELTAEFNILLQGRHTALGDALMTAQIFLNLLQRLAEKQIITLKQLSGFLSHEKKQCDLIVP